MFGAGAWFAAHIGLMVSTLVLTLIGGIIIFVFREGWSDSAEEHGYFGVIVFALVHCNLIMGVLRSKIGI